MTCQADAFVMLTATAVSVKNSNAALGFGYSMVLVVLLKARDDNTWEKLCKWTPWSKIQQNNAMPASDAHQV